MTFGSGVRLRAVAAMLGAGLLAQGLAATGAWAASGDPAKALEPLPQATLSLMAARETNASAPILLRIFKKEAELEVWKMSRAGRYVLLKSFPICRWSGQLGPKRAQGDRQAPEGFYAVAARQMNPNSSYHLSFDLGYPNAYDRAHGGTGSFLMVHGICSSMGCYAMTNEQVSEIYGLAREAFAGGQRAFQVQAYPFRMTAANLARARKETHYDFWRQLKEGYDRFEATGEEPAVGVAAGRYSFGPSRDPAREEQARARIAREGAAIDRLVQDGAAAVRITYQDGGQHAAFASLARRGVPLGEVSRPEALAFAGREIVLVPARKVAPPLPPVMVAAAPPIGLGTASGNVATLFVRARLGGEGAAITAGPAVMAGAAGILSTGMLPAGRPAQRLAARAI